MSIKSVPNLVPARRDNCPHFQGSYGWITEVVSWEAHLPQRWCAMTPPRSPDLSPWEFFLWGYLKGKVHVDKPRDSPQLQNAIERELHTIPRRMCEQVMTNFSRRLNECVKNKGRHLNDVIFHVWQFFLTLCRWVGHLIKYPLVPGRFKCSECSTQ